MTESLVGKEREREREREERPLLGLFYSRLSTSLPPFPLSSFLSLLSIPSRSDLDLFFSSSSLLLKRVLFFFFFCKTSLSFLLKMFHVMVLTSTSSSGSLYSTFSQHLQPKLQHTAVLSCPNVGESRFPLSPYPSFPRGLGAYYMGMKVVK